MFLFISYFCLLFNSSAEAVNTGQYFKGNGGYGEIVNTKFSDLDYTKSFSIETVIDIKPYENSSHRWPGIITKLPVYGLYNYSYAGWGLGICGAQEYKAQIVAAVSDGVNHAVVTSAGYVGRLNVIVTWNADTKTLTLYINGVQAGQSVNEAVVLANIKNTQSFCLAKSFSTLLSPVIYARLWNRELSAGDINTLYNHYQATKQHSPPSGFSTEGLISEWLMFEKSDSLGNAGTTHIKDSRGANHIELRNGADIVSNQGNLSLIFPLNGVVNQNKTVMVKTAGGYDTLIKLGAVTGPLQYYFQIDKTATFDSADLIESGWIADFMSWQPVLEADTLYYCRVRVRDSKEIEPLVSEYTTTQYFTTQSRTTWYVRPKGGYYGNEDGTSYDNAWDGLHSVVWGENGVEPGDTLYICGLHVWDVTQKTPIVGQGYIYVNVEGISEATRVIIRGDYPDDPGIVWGAYRMSYEPWQDEGGGVWSISLAGGAFPDCFFQDIGIPKNDSFIILDQEFSIEGVRNHPGSQYGTEGYVGNKLLYVKCTDGGNPTGRIYSNRYGYSFKLINREYITFLNLTLFNPYFTRSPSDSMGYANHLRWQGCKLAYGEYILLSFRDNEDYMEVINCDLSWSGCALYTVSTTNNAPSYYLFKGNYIHDIGVRPAHQNGDAHSIGIQGGHDGIIEDNVIENCGTGPLLYAFTNQELKNTIVRRNIVKNLHNLGGATGYGVSTMCNNNSLSDKSGNKFYQNIVINAPVGYRFQFEDEQEVYNNIAYNCNKGFESTRNYNGQGADVIFKNNIIADSKTYHIHWSSGATSYALNFDHNLYYSIEPAKFRLGAKEYTTLDQWKTVSKTDCVFDPNSLYFDPLFINVENGDFHLKADSSAIDNGIDVGLTEDPEGTAIPQGIGVDIGVYEYKPKHVSIAGDIDADGDVDVSDVRLCVNVILDIEKNSEIVDKVKKVAVPEDEYNVLDVQAVVNKVLGE